MAFERFLFSVIGGFILLLYGDAVAFEFSDDGRPTTASFFSASHFARSGLPAGIGEHGRRNADGGRGQLRAE